MAIVRTAGNELSVALKVLFLFIALFLFARVHAQSFNPCAPQEASMIIGPGAHGASLTRQPVPYPYVREADVMWSKRIWRTIDLREKMNFPYYFPEKPHNGLASLFDIIKGAVMHGCLTAYDNPAMDDEFKVKMSMQQVKDLLVSVSIIDVEDPLNPGTYKKDTIPEEINSTDVMAYWLKEDWFFDKERSVMDVRILGICPLATKKDPTTGEILGYKPLFWVYFPELRPIIAKQEVFLGQNFSQRLTYDDMFQKRFFSSYIRKESNVYDRSIPEYATGLDALLESEHIKEGIMDFESDLWHY
ncbi:MAG TPA: gliding motility protein GldN [Bacteroidia bacterium]|nr:gliding motility protein GldN [Bacteroidia bacterium]